MSAMMKRALISVRCVKEQGSIISTTLNRECFEVTAPPYALPERRKARNYSRDLCTERTRGRFRRDNERQGKHFVKADDAKRERQGGGLRSTLDSDVKKCEKKGKFDHVANEVRGASRSTTAHGTAWSDKTRFHATYRTFATSRMKRGSIRWRGDDFNTTVLAPDGQRWIPPESYGVWDRQGDSFKTRGLRSLPGKFGSYSVISWRRTPGCSSA